MSRLALVLVTLAPLVARGAELDRFTRRLATFGEQTRTLTARFIQRKKLRLFKDEVVTRGRLWYRRPGRLRWETRPPDRSLVVVSGHTARIQVPGDKPRVVDLSKNRTVALLIEPLLVWLGARPATGLSAAHELALRAEEGAYHLTLEPRDPTVRKRVRAMILTFDRQLMIRRITIRHAGGDRTRVELAEIVRNGPVPAGVFPEK